MRKYWIVLLIVILAAGCASASISSYPSSENQEEWVQKTLIGTWKGWIKDTTWSHIYNWGVTLQIYEIRKEQNSWTIKAFLDGKPPEYIKFYILYDDSIMLEIKDRYDGIYTLKPWQDTHLMGMVGWGMWKRIDPHEVIFEKISR